MSRSEAEKKILRNRDALEELAESDLSVDWIAEALLDVVNDSDRQDHQ